MNKILVANRGEIAIRVMRTAREMGIATVAVYSEADRNALHVDMADEAYLLGPAAPSQSYLNVEKFLDAAQRSGADGVHPGYGFLAENAAFARAVVSAGLVWIGPHADAIDAMGDKVRARQAMIAAGVPVVPGGAEALETAADARDAAKRFGLPIAFKASGGGGGKGLKIAKTLDEVRAAFDTARREAEAYFKNGTIYAERYLENPKHIELQLLADKHGNVVHVGERDCSLQRRHQKVLEEAPATIDPNVRSALRDAGLRAARAIAYDSVGTIECLAQNGEFYFLEMNTRIQVEHTVSEMIAGIDLVREQIRVASGEPLGFTQDEVTFRGHAIEGRVNAEEPARNFRPAPGTISRYREPAGPGVRVDSAARAGLIVGADYDSMIAKLVVWAPTRAQALARFRRAIGEYDIAGVPTTLPLLNALALHPPVIDASYGTATLESFVSEGFGVPAETAHAPAVANGPPAAEAETIRVEVNDKLFRVRLLDMPNAKRTAPTRRPPRISASNVSGGTAGNDIVAPMHGSIVDLLVAQGDKIAEGQIVAVVEAMKMMNEIRSHKEGTATKIHVQKGATVEANAPLVSIGP
ncbi:MAG: acetyl-CoA carboxylase biotin carboxylase subunit [Candidatus Eremiobacteraeota bacterium]|nr:acetyl-CoA carboxylase biotin carboxylase subunit [Candidatus Eremiobacteraeota bacterium]